MTVLLFANNAASTLASPINPASTSIIVVPGAGALFPSPAAGQGFLLTLVDAATGGIREIVLVTARTGDTMTIVRAQEGTTVASWIAGDVCQMDPTAGTMQNLSQVQQTQAGAPNFAVDTGTTNSYMATMSPAVTGRIPGLVFRILASTANTGPSTVNIGAGSISIVNPDGSTLGVGAIITNGVFELIDTGSGGYQLISSSQQAQSLAGGAVTGDTSWRATPDTKTGWVIGNATTIGGASSNATQRGNADASPLFTYFWNGFSNTQCPVYTSAGVLTTRGANAAADFAAPANKQIQIYEMRGRGIIGVDTMGGSVSSYLSGVPVQSGATTTAGSVLGENLHTLILSETPVHNHGGSTGGMSANDPHTHLNNANSANSNTSTGGGVYTLPATAAATINSTSVAHVHSIANAGSGAAHNNTMLVVSGYFYFKL
jgi:hypothetical protein